MEMIYDIILSQLSMFYVLLFVPSWFIKLGLSLTHSVLGNGLHMRYENLLSCTV